MERVFAELIRQAHGDYELTVISRELAPDLRPLVTWRRVRVPGRPVPLLFVLFYLVAGIRLARTKPDFVHTLGALVPNRADLASVHFCHAAFRATTNRDVRSNKSFLRRVNTRIQRALGLKAERASYRHARIPVLAAVSEGVARELEYFYPGTRVLVTPNGIDATRFRPDPSARAELRRSTGVSGEDVVALFVGGDWDHKGLSIAIEAIARSQTPSLRLWIVGLGDQNRFRALAERIGVAERVRFFGVRSDVERFYQAADLFVLPSLYESFSLAAFEAAACGLPLLATRVHGVAELLVDADCGLIVERAPESFAAALAALASDPERRTSMGTIARRRASAYTWQRSTDGVLAIYRERLGPNRVLADERAA
jgi:glycosyltransferase involved in cell wall biosynthesis